MKYAEEIMMFIFLSAVMVIIAILFFSQAGCVHKPTDTSMNINWEDDVQGYGQPDRKCLQQKDVEQLVEVIERCRSK